MAWLATLGSTSFARLKTCSRARTCPQRAGSAAGGTRTRRQLVRRCREWRVSRSKVPECGRVHKVDKVHKDKAHLFQAHGTSAYVYMHTDPGGPTFPVFTGRQGPLWSRWEARERPIVEEARERPMVDPVQPNLAWKGRAGSQ